MCVLNKISSQKLDVDYGVCELFQSDFLESVKIASDNARTVTQQLLGNLTIEWCFARRKKYTKRGHQSSINVLFNMVAAQNSNSCVTSCVQFEQ